MNPTTVLGLIAAFFTTLAFIPQAIKVIKTKHTTDLSLPMYIMFTVGISLWMTYGFIINDIPVILSNSVTLVFAVIILVMKLKYK
jgi:MtN3 and saliva related transmembrane protein